MSQPESPEVLRDDLRVAWQRYIDLIAPHRPVLHGYCLKLTRNLWDAEDLVQDTLLRAFGQLAFMNYELLNPRAYLLRAATNVYIDGRRRNETAQRGADRVPVPSAEPPPDQAADVRDASTRLMQRLSPQERAAVLLKESFDMGLDEIASLLATTTGAIKAALHRGRGRLSEPEGASASQRPRPSKQLVDAFLERLQARDVPGLLALMVDGGAAENVGCGLQYGAEQFQGKDNFLYLIVHGHPEWPPEFQHEGRRDERGEIDGESVVLSFVTRRGREALEMVLRLDESDGKVARLRSYGFCPETMRAIGEQLGVRVRTGLYRFPTPTPGGYYTDAAGDDA